MLRVRRKGIAATAGIVTAVAVALPAFIFHNADPAAEGTQVVAIIDARVSGATLIPGYICAGFPLSPRKILTAAHCVDAVPVDALRVVPGGPDLCADAANLELVEVDRVSITESHAAN